MSNDTIIIGLEEDIEIIVNSANDKLIIGKLVAVCARLIGLAKDQDGRICILESDLEQAQITLNELQGLCYSCGKNSADKDELCWECGQRQYQALEREASHALAAGAKAISDDDWLE